MKTFAERFGSLRKPDETQKEFADRIGLTQASISRYLAGKNPDRESINKIVKAADVSADWLLSGKEVEMSQDVDDIISQIGSGKTKPKEDKDWTEILLSYFDKIKSLPQEQREILKSIIREFVDEPDRRIDLVEFWNYLRFREKNPTMPVPKRKRRKKHS